MILDGRKTSNKIKKELKSKIEEVDWTPGLGIILVGDRPDSHAYVRMKSNACKAVGIRDMMYYYQLIQLKNVSWKVRGMNNASHIDGILIQLPLPSHIDEGRVLSEVALHKDVDGFHMSSMGSLALNRMRDTFPPCTPDGCIELLKRHDIEISGKDAVVVGRSNIVGLPLSLLLIHNNATTTICHSKTTDLKSHTCKADILIAACGKKGLITSEHVKPGAVVIDVGIHKVDADNKKVTFVGDTDYKEIKKIASYITPVPGGVGPMTIAMLLQHTFLASVRNRRGNLTK